MKKNNKNARIVKWAKEVITIEADALSALRKNLDDNFPCAVQLLADCRGKIIVTGMGKAGIIGQKFSATIASFGFSSFWVHPAEAVHGDLGRICQDDVIVVLSYSGETEEVRNLIPFLKNMRSKIIAITGNKKSNLSKFSHAVIDVKVEKEACHLGLAPTTSTTVMLAVCDAIAVSLQKLKGLKEKDFAFFHPRGSLGRKLLLQVKDIMRQGKTNPIVSGRTPVQEVLVSITSAHAGAASVVNKKKKLIGIFTDGDLRRHLGKDKNILTRPVEEVMTKGPVVVREDDLASAAVEILETKKIDEVPVVDKLGRPVGMLDVQDLIAAGVV
ncbi:MAG: KpsF/GutQ family sugar-phosphate isomerase [Candidatus Omnitrophica bacterium]|nr:KpsF/GutQ family sugar-phosphate isomerase [Candidatus Omnitrophota bacterium]